MYEESIRMPFIVRWPGVARPGSVCSALAINPDFAPTFLDAAGLPAPGEVYGLPRTRSRGGWLRDLQTQARSPIFSNCPYQCLREVRRLFAISELPLAFKWALGPRDLHQTPLLFGASGAFDEQQDVARSNALGS
jgi:hypothetical protein